MYNLRIDLHKYSSLLLDIKGNGITSKKWFCPLTAAAIASLELGVKTKLRCNLTSDFCDNIPEIFVLKY